MANIYNEMETNIESEWVESGQAGKQTELVMFYESIFFDLYWKLPTVAGSVYMYEFIVYTIRTDIGTLDRKRYLYTLKPI